LAYYPSRLQPRRITHRLIGESNDIFGLGNQCTHHLLAVSHQRHIEGNPDVSAAPAQRLRRVGGVEALKDDRELRGVLRPERVTHIFAARVKKMKIPTITLHGLRHTHATLALAAGIHAKVVSDRLGHSTVALTMDVYSHAIPAMEEEAASRIAALVTG
jgi:integrase